MNANNLKQADIEDAVWESKIALKLELVDQISMMIDETPMILYVLLYLIVI